MSGLQADLLGTLLRGSNELMCKSRGAQLCMEGLPG